MNCTVGIYGTNLKASRCTSSDAFFAAISSVALNQASRSSSSFLCVGQPNHALSPVAAIGVVAGDIVSAEIKRVWKIDQPPLSTGSFEVRRVISVPQSL